MTKKFVLPVLFEPPPLNMGNKITLPKNAILGVGAGRLNVYYFCDGPHGAEDLTEREMKARVAKKAKQL